MLQRLAGLGVTLSLDDVGTGYSSSSYLQRLPVQELTIDRSFVRGLEAGSTPEDTAVAAALIRSITALKHALGLRVVAEGVEDAHVLERVRELGCDLVQGYHVARPAPADQLDTSATRVRVAHVEAQLRARSVVPAACRTESHAPGDAAGGQEAFGISCGVVPLRILQHPIPHEDR